ncbi:MAG: ATP-binding protein [Oscillospiraceae bacterium]
MKAADPIPFRQQLAHMSLFFTLIAIITVLGGILWFTMKMEYRNLDNNLLNSAQVIAQAPCVTDALTGRSDFKDVTNYLDGVITKVYNIDAIVIVDADGTILYCPDPSYLGTKYPDEKSISALQGSYRYMNAGPGILGTARRALVTVHDSDSNLLGFVSIGISAYSIHHLQQITIGYFSLITAAAVAAAFYLSYRYSRSVKDSLMGFEPDAFRHRLNQREDILEALEEGILAIDIDAKIIYINHAAKRILGIDDKTNLIGEPLKTIYPESYLPRILETEKAEYNVNIQRIPGICAISDRMPIMENGNIAGAVEILRDRTEVTELAEDLTGVRHMVEAMRSYTHEFMNKLHIILGLIQLGQAEKAEQYILNITRVQQQEVSHIRDHICDPAVAAMLVGKTSRAAELGISLHTDPQSSLSGDERFLPSSALVTILGNLIENATDSLDRSSHRIKEIIVSIREKADSLLICVEDTGPGILPDTLPKIFKRGFSTKGAGRGTGLALVKNLVTLYHGQIRVESKPQEGAAFFVSFHINRGDINV